MGAQSRDRCAFESAQLTRTQTPGGQGNAIASGGVIIRCPSKEVVLRADSLESYGDDGRLLLFGHVRYNEPRLTLNDARSSAWTPLKRLEILLTTR